MSVVDIFWSLPSDLRELIFENLKVDDPYEGYKTQLCHRTSKIYDTCRKNIRLDDLKDAIEEGDIRKIEKFLKYGANVNMKFHHPEGTDTPLKLALSKNYIDIAKFLIENGADIHYTAETYLPWFYIRDVGMADYFLRHGADVNTLNYFGENLLFRHPSNDLLKFLISKGINVNQQTKTTSPTPLFTEINSFDNVKILLENGADPNIKNYLGETALDKARDNRVIRLLQQYGAENGDFRGYF